MSHNFLQITVVTLKPFLIFLKKALKLMEDYSVLLTRFFPCCLKNKCIARVTSYVPDKGQVMVRLIMSNRNSCWQPRRVGSISDSFGF
jgi:hypothetical protein